MRERFVVVERQRKTKAGETFRLPPPEVETFKQTVAKVEKWVLLSVEAKLELEILRAEAILARSEAAKWTRPNGFPATWPIEVRVPGGL